MNVIKRNGSSEPVSFDKVLARVSNASERLNVNPALISQKVLVGIKDGIKTQELDELTMKIAISLCTTHQDYGTLAARIAVSNHQRNTKPRFCEVMRELGQQLHPKTGEPISYVSKEILDVCDLYEERIEAAMRWERDELFDFFGFKTLEKQYLLKNAEGRVLERPQHLWMRVSLALWVGTDGLEKAFQTYDMMSMKLATHATPTLFNAGTPTQQLSSCFLLAMTDDSIKGIYKTLTDCALISKNAGGIGLHIHNVRAQGSLIRGTNGYSNGIVPMLRNFNATARYVDQGGGRRNGSFAIYLEPWHADIEEFLKLKLNQGAEEERARDLFYGLWIPDLFMKRVQEEGQWSLFCPNEAPGLADVVGDEFEALYKRYEREGLARRQIPAQKLWFRILDAQIETGTPYLLYKDAANLKSNQQNLGVIKSSNLCVAPETYILTDRGQYQISTLAGQTVKVWNGKEWSETTVMKTGENQRLVTVHLSNGAQITCTPYHKFITCEGYKDKSSIADATRVAAADLKEGMKLAKMTLSAIDGDSSQNILYPYTHGFFCGDGTTHVTPAGTLLKSLSLYGEKKKLLNKLQIRSTSGNEDAQGKINTMLPHELADKYVVPINASKKCCLEWLAGLLDSDGSVAHNGDNESLQIGSIHFEFLDRVRLMLQTLGVQSKVTKCFGERVNLLPDGKGGRKEYNCKPLYRLLISSSGLHDLVNIGLECHRLKITGVKPQRNAEQFVTIISVVDDDRVDDTYCFNEPLNHAGVFNGILTGNCTEILEYSSPEETAVCNLASLALPAFVNTAKQTFNFTMLRRTVAQLTENLNRVIDINYYPTPETKTSNMRHRPIGIGVQGLADVFAMLRLPWESEEAAQLNQEIFEHIYYAALNTSADIALKEGPYETFQGSPVSQGRLQPDMWNVEPLTAINCTLDWSALRAKAAKGIRNSLLVAPMPTASTSQILGYTECFEPVNSNIYTRRTLAGEFIVVNKYLLKDLMTTGIWCEDLKQKIIMNNGSVQNIQEIPKPIQDLYKTSYEIKQRILIDMAASRGAFICQSQSLNLFVADPTYAKLTSMHFYAWKKGLKTGIYYLRSKAPVMAQKFTVDPDLVSAAEQSLRVPAEEGCLLCSA
jgi:ribonucleoside-diphosphate reductase alpha chain